MIYNRTTKDKAVDEGSPDAEIERTIRKGYTCELHGRGIGYAEITDIN
ncbi:hypothetical protein CJF32_00007234 [Rutstroemia sp. NJR-2017a WRK4]|nr:hypothetical protein CJF32_00007234 [Rutstroemia sp. NJR-2017a WRK4]